MTVLHVENIGGGYSEVDILKGVELQVSAGEIVTVVGTNGAGKSTLIKAVMGLLPRLAGRILWEGQDIARASTERRLTMGIGYVPQVANVFASLTVHDNLLVVQGVPEVRRRAAEMFELFPALQPMAQRRAGALSGGERQQLAFAMALMSRPRLICLDEPTAALSPALVKTVFDQIVRLPELGCAVLMVEQRAREALQISQRGYIMDQGRVAMSGPAAGLLDDPRAVELYLGHEA
ncbi:ABC transporter ATP-binding protein [Hydrogenophaga sp. OTU3427]|uniref:ABC transporter ATP-binding protein n=1 Tax=Hydrogenophaga sp. OTU3427 TaxID=3043856 RepID=UPI00313E5A15